MTDPTVVIIGSFLLAFKAILVEGSEVAILSLATIKQLGRNNILFGVIAGGLGSILTFLAVYSIFKLLPVIIVDFATAVVLFYFSSRFLRGFIKYRFRHKSFREKMARMGKEVVEKDLRREGAIDSTQPIRFSVPNSLPVLTITLTEGFEASLVLAAAGAFNILWTLIGAGFSLLVLVIVSAISYDYLMRVPRWLLDIIAGLVLLTFGSIFLASGILSILTGTT
jgi:Ca2+/H+ antiporter, TMEM165/GDT1 family